VKVWDIRDLGCKSPVSQLDCLVSDRCFINALSAYWQLRIDYIMSSCNLMGETLGCYSGSTFNLYYHSKFSVAAGNVLSYQANTLVSRNSPALCFDSFWTVERVLHIKMFLFDKKTVESLCTNFFTL